jgi:menaquinone-dependent protoporphyrinogen oxidase
MSRVLILYGTTDGHTRKIAAALQGILSWEGSRVDVIEARDVAPHVRPEDYDAVVVAASLHIWGYQRAVKRWVRAHAAGLSGMPSAFVSVCLGILDQRPDARRQVQQILQRFLDRSRWRPLMTTTVAGAVPYTRHHWLRKWVMKRLVARAGGGTDTTRDYEYTNWDDLRAFARGFAGRLEPLSGLAVVVSSQAAYGHPPARIFNPVWHCAPASTSFPRTAGTSNGPSG